jgi:hypothetical protein
MLLFQHTILVIAAITTTLTGGVFDITAARNIAFNNSLEKFNILQFSEEAIAMQRIACEKSGTNRIQFALPRLHWALPLQSLPVSRK